MVGGGGVICLDAARLEIFETNALRARSGLIEIHAFMAGILACIVALLNHLKYLHNKIKL